MRLRLLTTAATLGLASAALTGCHPATVAQGPTPTGQQSAPAQDAASGSAAKALARLQVRAKSTMAGYTRNAFGPAWSDDTDDPDGHNHCDTRDDILARDLTQVTYK